MMTSTSRSTDAKVNGGARCAYLLRGAAERALSQAEAPAGREYARLLLVGGSCYPRHYAYSKLLGTPRCCAVPCTYVLALAVDRY